jgi:hypothetical protein
MRRAFRRELVQQEVLLFAWGYERFYVLPTPSIPLTTGLPTKPVPQLGSLGRDGFLGGTREVRGAREER